MLELEIGIWVVLLNKRTDMSKMLLPNGYPFRVVAAKG